MPHSICQSCRTGLRLRYRQQIFRLQNTRRQKSAGSNSQPLESWYWDTLPPNPRQLAAAKWFFDAYRPQKLWTANEWQSKSHSGAGSETLIPEVAFLGRSNAGKSSLLNALLNEPTLNRVGAKPGKTTTLHAYGLSATPTGRRMGSSYRLPGAGSSKSLVTVLDAPGYGYGSQDDWGEGIIKYLKQRRQLRRIFVLINAQHGIHKSDLKMLTLLREQTVCHQVIATKCDRLEPPTQRQEKINQALELIQKAVQPHNPSSALVGLGEILAVGWLGDGRSNLQVKRTEMQGLGAVQWSVLRAAGLDDYVLSQFSQLDQATDYDNTPMQPNAVSRVQDLQIREKKYAPFPPVAFPETASPSYAFARSTPDPGGHGDEPFLESSNNSQGRPGVTLGIDALLSAIDKPKSRSKAPQPQPAGAGKSRLARRRADKRAVKPKQIPSRPYLDKAMSKQARSITPTGQNIDEMESLHASMEELLASSVEEGMRSDEEQKRQKGQRSQHRNPFA